MTDAEPIDATAEPINTDPMLAIPALPTLPAKDGPLPVAGDVLAFLQDRGIAINGDTVNVKSDGTVEVDTDDPKALAAAWKAYEPPPAPPSPLDVAQAALDAATDIDALKAWLAATVLPRLGL